MERDIRTMNIGTMGDLVHGRAGRQFEEAMRHAIGAVTDPESVRSSGIAKAEILVRVTVEGTSQEDGGAVSLAVSVESKHPKLRSSGAMLIHIKGDSYGVDLTDLQQRMFTGPRAVTGE